MDKTFNHVDYLWDDAHAKTLGDDQVALFLYRSNILGSDLRITNYGGGNTSCKTIVFPPLFQITPDHSLLKTLLEILLNIVVVLLECGHPSAQLARARQFRRLAVHNKALLDHCKHDPAIWHRILLERHLRVREPSCYLESFGVVVHTHASACARNGGRGWGQASPGLQRPAWQERKVHGHVLQPTGYGALSRSPASLE